MTENKSENKADGSLVFLEVHEVDERTEDVLGEGSFDQFLMHPTITEKLNNHGFHKPSPVQAKAIPLGLLGMDLLVQAKTGTGKTLVFIVLTIDHLLNAETPAGGRAKPLVMIVSPTREIAMQSHSVLRKLCPRKFYSGLFVGGMDIDQQENSLQRGVHVVVGTSGRLAHLVKRHQLNLKHISLFVLDEADKLMEEAFRAEINYLFSSLTPNCAQVCVFSATYPRQIDGLLCAYMREPSLVRLNADDVQLIGVKQYALVDYDRDDVDVLLEVLSSVSFAQCLVFTNDQTRCQTISERLEANGINNAFISSSLPQDERFKVMKSFRNYKLRVLISTDLSARGIDVEHVNLIVNMECPVVSESYLHRIGRAGRFGTRGAALTILANKRDTEYFKLLARRERVAVKLIDVKEHCPIDLPVNVEYYKQARSFQALIDEDDKRFAKMYTVTPQTGTNSGTSLDDEEEKENSIESTLANKPKVIVAQRAGKGTKYYLRREMLAIRDLATSEEWRIYAQSRLACCTDPLLIDAVQPIHWSKPPAAYQTPSTWTGRVDFHYQSRFSTAFKKKHIKPVYRWQPPATSLKKMAPLPPPPAPKVETSPPPKPVRPPRDVPLRPRAEYHAYMERIMRQMDVELRVPRFELHAVDTADVATSTTVDRLQEDAAVVYLAVGGGDAQQPTANETTSSDGTANYASASNFFGNDCERAIEALENVNGP